MASAVDTPRTQRPLLITLALALVVAVVMALASGARSGYGSGATTGGLQSATPVAGTDLGAEGVAPAITPTELLTESGFVQTQSMSSMTRRLHVSWPTVSGQPALDENLRSRAQSLADRFTSEYAPPAPSQVTGIPELNARWMSVGVSESIIGLLSDQVLNVPGADSASWATTWYSLKDRRVLEVPDLVTSTSTLTALLQKRLAQQLPGVNLTPAELAAMPVLAFSTDGRLLAGYDRGVGSTKRITIALTKQESDAVLSARGRLAQQAATKPSVPVTESAQASATPQAPATPMGGAVNCKVAKCVALTFDDGPGPETNRLLGILASKQTPATFFVLGRQVAAYPQELQAEIAAGHQVGVHTWDHRDLTRMDEGQVTQEISRTVDIIHSTTGVRPTTFRPPYGATNKLVESRVAAAGLSQILWNVDTMDWSTRDTAATLARASKVKRGSIVLMHDIQPSTVPAVAGIIDALRARGLTPVTVDTLLGRTKPGATYFDGITGAEAPDSERKASWGQK